MNPFAKCVFASAAAMAMLFSLGCSEAPQPASEQGPDLLCYEKAEGTGDGNEAKLAYSSPIGIGNEYSFSSSDEDWEMPVWINVGMESFPEATSVEFSALDEDVQLSWNDSSPSQSVTVPFEEIESILGGNARLISTVRMEPLQETGPEPDGSSALVEVQNKALAAFEEGLGVRTVFEDGSEEYCVYSFSPTEEFLQARTENTLQAFDGARFEIRKVSCSTLPVT